MYSDIDWEVGIKRIVNILKIRQFKNQRLLENEIRSRKFSLQTIRGLSDLCPVNFWIISLIFSY